MSKYADWVKKATAPDIENFLVLPYSLKEKNIKASVNLLYCFFLLFLQITMGLINPSSSHTFFGYYSYILVFIPFPSLMYGAYTFFSVPVNLTSKQHGKSLACLKHSATGIIVLESAALLAELVYLFRHFTELKGMTGSLSVELVLITLQVLLLTAAVMYGVFYNRYILLGGYKQ